MKNKLYIIGVTGNICSGKSAAASFLGSQKQAKSLNLDEFGHIIYQKNYILLNKIKRHYKNIISNPNSIRESLNRKELGKIVFNDAKQMAMLNSLMLPEIHSLLRLYIENLRRRVREPIVLYIEGAIIGENRGDYYPYDEIWLVMANKEEIERRFKERLVKNMIKEYDPKILEFILKRQMGFSEKMKYCSEVIDTNNEFDITKLKFIELHNKVLKKLI
jgi:dephospho-CoA kinase